MFKKIFLVLLLILSLFVYGFDAEATTSIYAFNVLTGGGPGALDKIDGATPLLDGDMAIVITKDDDVNYPSQRYQYTLDDDCTSPVDQCTESVPEIIAPDNNAGNKRWILTGIEIFKTAVTGSERASKIIITTDVDATGPVVVGLQVDGGTRGDTTNPFVIPLQINSSIQSIYTGADLYGASSMTLDTYVGYPDETRLSTPTTMVVKDWVGIQSSMDRASTFDDVDATYQVTQAYNIRAFIDGGSYGGTGSKGKMYIVNYYGIYSDNWRHPLNEAYVDNFYFFYADESYDTKQVPDDQNYADICSGCPTSYPAGKLRNYGFYGQVADGGSIENVGVYVEMTGRGSAGGAVSGIVVDGDEQEAILVRKSGDAGDVFIVSNNVGPAGNTVSITQTDNQDNLRLISTSNATAPAFVQTTGIQNSVRVDSAVNSSIYDFVASYNLVSIEEAGGAVGDIKSIVNVVKIAGNSVATTYDNFYTIENILSQTGTNGNQTITNFYGLYSHSSYSGTGTLSGTNWRHAYFADFAATGGTIANTAGLWIDRQTIGTNNYGIVLNGDGEGADIALGASQDHKISYDGTDNGTVINDSTGEIIEVGRGTTDTDITYMALRNSTGTKIYIYPDAAGTGVVASATRP